MSEHEFYPNNDTESFNAVEAESYEISEENRGKVMLALRNCGVGLVRINFSGGGDDGQIDDNIDFQGIAGDPKKIEVSKIKATRDHTYMGTNGEFLRIKAGDTIEKTGNLHTMIMEFADDIVGQDFPYDWCNNEGGNGTIEIRPGVSDRGEILVLYSQRIETTEDHKLSC